MKIIDTVLSADGFVRETNSDMVNVPGYIVSYVKYESPELRSGILPDVYLKQGQLMVEIVELGNRTAKPSAISKLLSKELTDRFGKRRVKIRDWP